MTNIIGKKIGFVPKWRIEFRQDIIPLSLSPGTRKHQVQTFQTVKIFKLQRIKSKPYSNHNFKEFGNLPILSFYCNVFLKNTGYCRLDETIRRSI